MTIQFTPKTPAEGQVIWMVDLRRGDFVVQQITKHVLDRFAASS